LSTLQRHDNNLFNMKILAGPLVFLAALLLFLVEPMAARELLPVFGGSAAVWITCLVFFQGALLCGYLYADFVARRGGVAWIAVHVSLLLVAVVSAWLWALGWMGSGWAAASLPVAGIFGRLALWIGVPFLLLAATSPLLQAWVARPGRVPYRLFGLSNLASLLALLAYPTVVEPYLTLQTQRMLWGAGVTVFALLAGVVAWQMRGEPIVGSAIAEDGAVSRRRTKLLWFLLPMVSAMQLSAVTEHLTVNVAAIPLLWVLPLAVYLATFVVAFQFGRSLPRYILLGLLAVMLVGLGSFAMHPEMALPVALGIGMFLLELLLACMFCHSELYGLRPQRVDEVTKFYLTIAAGGAAGAFLVGIVAPAVFHADYDLSITFAVTGVLVLAMCWGEGMKQRLLWGGVSLLVLFFLSPLRSEYGHQVLYSTRNFYGGLRVTQTQAPDGDVVRTLMHGTVTHGTEIMTPELQRVPTAYYGRGSGVGLALRLCCGDRARRIGVVGLGAGTLAAYGRVGDEMRFYEINPAVRPIAQNLFAYLRNSAATISFAEGDARASLAAEPAQGFDVLAIDAFSGDAIPLHLLTVQALAIYRKHLAPGGVLAFHVSNRYVDLAPELAELANSAGMEAREVTDEEDDPDSKWVSTWVLLTTNGDFLRMPEMHPLIRRTGVKAWTDDYSSLLPLIRW
jgi:spermidine synthase